MPLIEYKKKLNKELEEVRDELSAFNASWKIDYELPEGIL
jgi:frataxin-like iron-binding protein CyaY